ncbi:asparagine synthase (glutamine-hydrolyzing) [Cuspidothrix issatschenkoi]|uniref:asparagine synthase (glutamine-hydrolyzing) n=1 Tax=Cuspidothrix issatschenkoi CHARLIE-1 TaxID=2052836 RepID=A0A2S6CTJ4_9CYAN|nr:asparagine synthase (glutamine-hydrolyzing) [Cuspidothrix issatschenkoi]PPJ63022.1 asparagine synthase (glutamine-hydrolyzing) [Cuspidothrix issatschenkoi CHARLIE-1]
MCGITGIWNQNLQPINRDILKSFTDIISHRGPDDSGFYFADDVGLGLGHRRLAILDLSPAGHQPMPSRDGKIWLVFNGEIYNYLELAAELTNHGFSFQSHCDTEIIIAAYQTWGFDCLNRFNGMFAFLLWDDRKKLLWAVRDRFGIKPLYIYQKPHQLIAFASEIKQFTTLPQWQAQINPQKAYDFLAYGLFDHTHETLFQSVWQLRGGEYLTLSLDQNDDYFGKIQVKSWYKLPNKSLELTLPEAANSVYKLLNDSIKLRLQADVTVGSCLSGGLDSSSIVCLANQIRQHENTSYPFQTFSSCFDIPQCDERPYINSVVTSTNVKPHYIFPDPLELFNLLDKITWHQDEPFCSTSIFAQWCIFQQANKSGVKVILDGQGSDEYFAGYHGFYGALFKYLLQKKQLINLSKEIIFSCRYQGSTKFLKSVESILPGYFRQIIRQILGYPSATKFPFWINSDKMRSLDINPHDPFKILHQTDTPIQDLSALQLTNTSLPMLLHWEDRNSMAHSIEARVPFLDYRIVEFVYGLDDSLKIKNGETKTVLRSAMTGIIPNSVRNRKDKMGFVTPEYHWMRETLYNTFESELQAAITTLDLWLHPQLINQMFADIIAGKRLFNPIIWRVINFSRWVKVFNVKIP